MGIFWGKKGNFGGKKMRFSWVKKTDFGEKKMGTFGIKIRFFFGKQWIFGEKKPRFFGKISTLEIVIAHNPLLTGYRHR